MENGKWKGMELYKAWYIQYSRDDGISDIEKILFMC
jgi:hypothetical protein